MMSHKGGKFVVMVDYYSRWVEVVSVKGEDSREVCDKMDSVYARFGAPKTLRTDNGPCFASRDFAEYCRKRNITHITSSPMYPESNGLVERMIRTVKTLVTKTGDFYTTLWDYRTTPLQSGFTPAELMFGRRIANGLPEGGMRRGTVEAFREADEALKRGQEFHHHRRNV